MRARFAQTSVLPPAVFDDSEGQLLELGGGAWRTLRGHVRRWERYENFVHGTDKPFFDVDLLLSYLVALESAGVGVSVLPAFTSTVKWIAGRLRVQAPVLPVHIVNRLQEKLVERRGVDTVATKEAPVRRTSASEVRGIHC